MWILIVMGICPQQCKVMEYKLKKINIDIEKPEDLAFPEFKDRVIERHGAVEEFTLSDIEANKKELLKTKKELEAKKQYENVRKENVEQHHPFVLEMSEQDLFTAWMYKEASGWVKLCDEKLKLIDDQLKADEEEIAEIKKQIPELALIESPYEQKGDQKGE